MIADINIRKEVEELFSYGFKLEPGTPWLNKASSIMLIRDTSIYSYLPGNINLYLNNTEVGHYNSDTGKFSYHGGTTLVEAFPPKRIRQVFSDLTRRYLDSDKSNGIPMVNGYDIIHIDHWREPTIYQIIETLKLVGLFEIPFHKFILGYFSVEIKQEEKLIIIRKHTTRKVLCEISQDICKTYSNSIDSDIIEQVLQNFQIAINEYLKTKAPEIEPPIFEWVDRHNGVRAITLDWVLWNTYTKQNDAEYAVKRGMQQVAENAPKGIGANNYKRYAEKVTGLRTFVVYYDKPTMVMD